METNQKPEPLAITCSSTDCENNLHYFKQIKKMKPEERGKCRECGADLVDWPRIHRRDIGDAEYTFNALRYELIRHHYFHLEIDEKAISHAQRKGRIQLKQSAWERLTKCLPPNNPWDGRQTKMTGNAIFYAQHATATCCRKCLECWHGIPKGQPLTEEEIKYCFRLVEFFLDERLPDLKDEPERVPRL